jgi:hypothetical protein
MKVQIKRLDGKRWKPLLAEELVGKSTIDFLLESQDTLVAAAFDPGTDKPFLFISNNPTYVEMYKERGVSLSAKDVRSLFLSENVPQVVAHVFPDGEIGAMTAISEQGNLL